jgi:polyisoprenoid-binding protein YceI
MFRRRIAFAALFSALTFSFVASADLALSGEGKFRIDGAAKPKIGPRLKFDGRGTITSAKVEGGNLVLKADLVAKDKDGKDKFDLGERTEHAREDFRCKDHPTATLTVPRAELKVPEDKQELEGTVTGQLKLKGQTKPVTVKYKVKRAGGDVFVKDAKFDFNYTDFGMEPICRFGKSICVEPKVFITVKYLKLSI